MSNECPRRKHKCQYCEEEGEYQEQMSVHLDTCPGVSVDCPNEGCNKRYPRSNTSSHANICDYQMIPCKYAEVGCQETLLRKDLQEHEKNNTLHLKTTIVFNNNLLIYLFNNLLIFVCFTVLALKQNIIKMSSKTKTGHTIMVRMPARNYKSEPFYSKNYKMYLSVNRNEVHIYLQKGKYDNFLTWPFQGIVTIELLNILEDKHHYQRKIKFKKKSSCGQRVVNDARAQGLGYNTFLIESDKSEESEKNYQCLKNDTLIFRVSVEIPDYKPWLECDQ